ncbi:hypothetical protein PYCCODRAFT_693692 [Trametes coccinea BRFM310]|uniref:Uncharacterized protein n=1 Tax=Trametes coccinea (strain BRFM310) TaxID=1353009 RepID=A0A1Y2IKU9_TRAC3|nr:hypothetical protein PYCCODRAFT_693692 [Trametes coccinea BRFM310]
MMRTPSPRFSMPVLISPCYSTGLPHDLNCFLPSMRVFVGPSRLPKQPENAPLHKFSTQSRAGNRVQQEVQPLARTVSQGMAHRGRAKRGDRQINP